MAVDGGRVAVGRRVAVDGGRVAVGRRVAVDGDFVAVGRRVEVGRGVFVTAIAACDVFVAANRSELVGTTEVGCEAIKGSDSRLRSPGSKGKN